MLNWIVWNGTIFIEMDLAWNKLQRLICHKTQTNNQPTNLILASLALTMPWKGIENGKFYDNINQILTLYKTLRAQSVGFIIRWLYPLLNGKTSTHRIGASRVSYYTGSDGQTSVLDSVDRPITSQCRSKCVKNWH